MHWSRELLALTAGVRWRIAGLVVIGLLIVAASLASFVCAGRAIAAVFAGRPLIRLLVPHRRSGRWPQWCAACSCTCGRPPESARPQPSSRRCARASIATSWFWAQGIWNGDRTGELVASAVDGVEQLETYYGKYLPQLLVTVLAPIGILIYLWSLDPPLAVVMGVFLPLALLGPWLFRKATSSSGNWHWRAYASFAALVLDSLQGLPTLKAFARGKARGQEIAEQSETLYRATMRILAVNLWSTGVMDLAIVGGAAVALAVGALRAVEGHIGVGSLLIIFLLGNEVFRPVRELGRLYHQGLNGVSAAQGIFALLAEQPEVVEPAHPLAPGREALTIRFEGVTFGYDGGQRPALREFDLDVAAGETVALVGSSGAGKTTVLNLLLRSFDPQQGRLRHRRG